MKLKKHINIIIKVLSIVVSRSSTRKFARDELCRQINNEIDDKRLRINKQQLGQIIKQQNELSYEKNREIYDFEGGKNERI